MAQRVTWIGHASKDRIIVNYFYLQKSETEKMDEIRRLIQEHYVHYKKLLTFGKLRKALKAKRCVKTINNATLWKYIILLSLIKDKAKNIPLIRIEGKRKPRDDKYMFYRYIRMN